MEGLTKYLTFKATDFRHLFLSRGTRENSRLAIGSASGHPRFYFIGQYNHLIFLYHHEMTIKILLSFKTYSNFELLLVDHMTVNRGFSTTRVLRLNNLATHRRRPTPRSLGIITRNALI